jgi:hypothetical protein
MAGIRGRLVEQSVRNVLRNYEGWAKKKRQNLLKIIALSAINVQRNIRRRWVAVRDTGRLINSVQIEPHGLSETKHIGVEASVHYAPYIEFGTGDLVKIPAGLEEYAAQFKGRGIRKVNLPARPAVFPSFEEEKPKLLEAIAKEMKQ